MNEIVTGAGQRPDATGFALPQRDAKPRKKGSTSVIDWGPDFDAEESPLPRWRWVVSDADQALRRIVGIEAEDTPNYLMLGNERSYREAWMAALAWVEQQQQHPEQTVVVW